MNLNPTRVLAVIGAALVLMIGGAVAYASIPALDGTITGCVLKSSGVVRIIDTATESCKTSERTVPWNQAGQPGTPGVSGYEVVQDQGTNSSFPSSNNTIGYSESVTCPAGKKMLGWFAHASFNGGVVDAADSELFTTSAGLDQVTVTFTKGAGEPFRDGDVSFWRIKATCAAVS